MKKIFLSAMLASLGFSIYPAKVLIRNQTDSAVFVRINNQKRSFRFLGIQEGIQMFHSIWFSGGSDPAPNPIRPIAGLTSPIFEAHGKIAGYPNFIPVRAGGHIILGTALVNQIGKPKGGLIGLPIKSITFARIIDTQTITGTIQELQRKVNTLAKKYGGIELNNKKFEIKLTNELTGKFRYSTWDKSLDDDFYNPITDRQKWKKPPDKSDKEAVYSIPIPVLEEFTYDLGKDKIGWRKNGIVELKSWGNAVTMGTKPRQLN